MKQYLNIAILACLSPAASVAQEAEPGGVFFNFAFDQRFEGSTDRDLATTESESGFDSITTLGFEAVTETRTERLSLGLETGVRIAERELTNDTGSVRLAYTRNSADALVELTADWVQSDIAFLRDASDFIDSDGVLVLPDDFDELTGTGTRSTSTLAASVIWGETDPVGYSLSISQQFLRYVDASAALTDTDTTGLGTGVRLNINEVTSANLGLRYTQTDEIGGSVEDSALFSGALTFDRPLGNLTTRISMTRDDDGLDFWTASVERGLAMPRGTFEASIGVAEDEIGEAQLTGLFSYSHALPNGQIDLGTARTQAAGGDSLITTVQASYAQDLTPVSNMRLGLDYAHARDSDDGDTLATGGLSASYGISLTEYWQLNVGVRRDARDDDGSRSRSSTLFLALDRDLSWRP